MLGDGEAQIYSFVCPCTLPWLLPVIKFGESVREYVLLSEDAA